MEESSKRKIIVFFILLIGCIALISLVTPMLRNKIVEITNKTKVEATDDSLKDVGYKSTVNHVGYPKAEDLANAFVKAFNDNDGEALASITNLQSEYIYEYVEDTVKTAGTQEENLKEETIKNFDSKYEEVMKDPNSFSEFVLMQYSMADREVEIINGMPEIAPTYTLLNEPEIESLSTYLTKMTLVIHVESEELGLNEDDTLELMLLYRDNIYYLMNYSLVDSKNI